MKLPGSSRFVFPGICVVMLLTVLIRSFLVPFSHDEVATFYFYIQPGDFIPFYAHPDANGHFLTNILGWVCFKLFGSSPFSLRLPSALAFALLCYAVLRWLHLFRSGAVRYAFAGAFIVLFPFTAYFSMCRGYGISMACLLLAMFYFFSYINGAAARHFFKFLLFIQLALAANLTLLFVAGLCTVFILSFQIRRAALFRPFTIGAYLLHIGLLFYWTAFAFFLKDQGALYYGAGDSYWEVTFKSLIGNLFGEHVLFQIILVLLFAAAGIVWLIETVKYRAQFLISARSVAWILLLALIASFYFLKLFIGVNYPEDRTGMFFYVFVVIACCLLFDNIAKAVSCMIFVVPFLIAVLFAWHYFNLYNHPWKNYETLPPSFHKILVEEQKKQVAPVTIAGHRIREFIYGFLNYRSDKKLSHMTSPEALQMNCDYAVAVAADKPWYDEYYSELAAEDRWGFRLLKRKDAIKRIPLLTFSEPVVFEGENEYFNCFDVKDTSFGSENPLQAQVTFEVSECPGFLKAWFILQVDAEDENENVFVRAPLDLIYDDWRKAGKFTLAIVTGRVPRQIKRMVLYLWNIDKKPVRIKVFKSEVLLLEAEGINVVSQAKL